MMMVMMMKMGQEAVTMSAAAPANGFALSLHLWELLFFFSLLPPTAGYSLSVSSRKCFVMM